MPLVTQIALVFLGVLLALDRGPFLQSMVSRPMPAGALAGLVIGDPGAGLLCGVYLELLWLCKPPVGGVVPPDDTLAALAGALAAAAAPAEWAMTARAAMGVLVGMPYAFVGRRFDIMARHANAGLLEWTRMRLEGGDSGAPARAQRRGVKNFVIAAVTSTSLAVVSAGPIAAWLAAYAPLKLEAGLEVFGVLVPVLGVGSVLGCQPGRRPRVLFLIGAAGAFACSKAMLKGTLWQAFTAARSTLGRSHG